MLAIIQELSLCKSPFENQVPRLRTRAKQVLTDILVADKCISCLWSGGHHSQVCPERDDKESPQTFAEKMA